MFRRHIADLGLRNLADARSGGGRLDDVGSNVDTGDLRQEYAEVTLLHLELTDWRSDLGGERTAVATW
jgi:hypothetical protein